MWKGRHPREGADPAIEEFGSLTASGHVMSGQRGLDSRGLGSGSPREDPRFRRLELLVPLAVAISVEGLVESVIAVVGPGCMEEAGAEEDGRLVIEGDEQIAIRNVGTDDFGIGVHRKLSFDLGLGEVCHIGDIRDSRLLGFR